MIGKFFTLSGFKISIFITFFFAALFSWNYIDLGSESFVELLDKKIIDFIQQSKGNTLESDNIAIIAIDTKSVDHYGRWPWGRNIMADLLHELETHYKIRVFAYDALFSESDTNDVSSEKVIDRFYKLVARESLGSRREINKLKRIRAEVSAEVNNDAKFGAELSKWNNIVLGYFFFLSANVDQIKHLSEDELAEFAKRIENSKISIIQGAEHLSYLPMYEGEAVEANIPMLTARGSLSGFFNVVPDREDGTIRRVPLAIKYKETFYPSLDLQILRRYYADAPIRMVVNEGGIEAFYVGKKRINTAGDGSVMINYRGPAFTFPHYSTQCSTHCSTLCYVILQYSTLF